MDQLREDWLYISTKHLQLPYEATGWQYENTEAILRLLIPEQDFIGMQVISKQGGIGLSLSSITSSTRIPL